ncbi:16S rRNA (cytidine(1402)-2'-O)-methyltransferase [soil metagenome]
MGAPSLAGAGRIVLVATPIGNLDDLSPRAVAAFAAADVVAAEDTRRTGRLLSRHELRRPLVRYDDHTEDGRTADLVERAAAGEIVAVATDAGTPGISDPGHVLVRAAVERGIAVELIPGPVAAIHALVLSGLPTDRFVFEGFLPRRRTQRRDRIAALADDPRTSVWYLSPHRAADELGDLAAALGPRPAALARELTKLHEQILRLSLDELAATVDRDGVRGELTLVVGGAPVDDRPDPARLSDADLVARVRDLIATGMAKNAAIATVARATGAARARVYDATVVARNS